MDEARRLMARLDRIEKLKSGGAPGPVLLEEVRRLLREGEDWLAAERGGRNDDASDEALERAAAALERGRMAVERGGEREGVIVGAAGYDR